MAVPVPAADEGEEGISGRKVKFTETEAEEKNDEAAAPVDPAEERRAEVRRTRARLLLDALEASEG